VTSGRPAEAGMKLHSIQYLRAIAASGVVLYHGADSLLGHDAAVIPFDYGQYGVDIFFVVSGFIMFYTTWESAIAPADFFVRRLVRIVPLYFLLSTLMLVIVSVAPVSFNKESGDFAAYLESVLFIPHHNPRADNLEPIIGQGWTLNYEMFFYVLFAAALSFRVRFRGALVIPVLALLVLAGWLFPVSGAALLTYTNPLLLEFCFGIAVAASILGPSAGSGSRWPLALIALLAASILYLYAFHAGLAGSEPLRPFFVGLPSALTVAILVLIELKGRLPFWAPLFLIGEASYSLYLVHGFVMGVARRLWMRFFEIQGVASHALYMAATLAASLVIAVLTYRHIELQLTRRIGALLRVRPARGTAAPAARGMD
jgi:exopolysaccharide production protein ExoZ